MSSSGRSIESASRNCAAERIPSLGASWTNAIGSAGRSLSLMWLKQPAPARPNTAASAALANGAAAKDPRLEIPVEERCLADTGVAHRDHQLRAVGVERRAVGPERASCVGVGQVRRGVDVRVVDDHELLPRGLRAAQSIPQLLLVDPERARR